MKKKYLISVLLLIAFRIMPIPAQEQTISFNHYTHADGLSNNWVFSIMQDDRGFLWIGTWDGLNKFDGKDFEVFLHDDADANTPAGREIKCMVQDPGGLIWMGTENGICSVEPLAEQFTSFDTASSYIKNGYTFQRIQKLHDPSGDGFEEFGSSCAIDGQNRRFFIGAPGAYNYVGNVIFGKGE